MDFHTAGIKHLLWKKNIRALLDGKKSCQDVETLSHKDCELTSWFENKAIPKYGHTNEIIEFETLHIEMHMISNRIIHMLSRGENDLAETEFKTLEDISKKLVKMLTVMALNFGED